MRVLFVNGHVWQSEGQREPSASWLLISGPKGDRNADGKVLAVGAGDAPEEHRLDSGIGTRACLFPPSLLPSRTLGVHYLPCPSLVLHCTADNERVRCLAMGTDLKSGTTAPNSQRRGTWLNTCKTGCSLPLTLSGPQKSSLSPSCCSTAVISSRCYQPLRLYLQCRD